MNISIIYTSQTGNTKEVAEMINEVLIAGGHNTTCINIYHKQIKDDYINNNCQNKSKNQSQMDSLAKNNWQSGTFAKNTGQGEIIPFRVFPRAINQVVHPGNRHIIQH